MLLITDDCMTPDDEDVITDGPEDADAGEDALVLGDDEV